MKTRSLPRLPRSIRIVRNLLLALLILLYMWGRNNFSIPDPRLNFRRMERANLMGLSDIQGVFRDEEGSCNWWVVGTEEEQVILFRHYNAGGTFFFWPKGAEGTALVPLPIGAFEFCRERDIIAADVPEGTASARLDLTVECWHNGELWQYQTITVRPEDYGPDAGSFRKWEKTYTAEGELLKDGGILFRVLSDDEGMDLSKNVAGLERIVLNQVSRWEPYYRETEYRSVNCRMEAVFYNEDGAELGRAVLNTPE